MSLGFKGALQHERTTSFQLSQEGKQLRGESRTVAMAQHTSKLEKILLRDACVLHRTVVEIPTFTPSFTMTTAFTPVINQFKSQGTDSVNTSQSPAANLKETSQSTGFGSENTSLVPMLDARNTWRAQELTANMHHEA